MDAAGAPPPTLQRRRLPRLGWGWSGVLLLVWATVATIGPALEHTDVRTASVSGVREVVVEVDAGIVTLRSGSGSDVGLRTILRWILLRPTAERSVVDGVLTVVARCPTIGIDCRVEEELTIPYGVAVRVSSSAGRITAIGLDVPSLDVVSSTAAIDAHDVSAVRLTARSGARSVSVSFVHPPAEARVESGAGDVELTVPAGRYRVDTGTSAGAVTDEVVQDPSAARLLYARSPAGSVTIRHR